MMSLDSDELRSMDAEIDDAFESSDESETEAHEQNLRKLT